MANGNAKTSALIVNSNPLLTDVFPIVNNGTTKKISLTGLTDFLNANLHVTTITGGTFGNGTLTLTDKFGDSVQVTGFTDSGSVGVTGGTYDNNTGTASFVNATGGTFNVTGFPKNVKHWLNNETKVLSSDETLVISGNYVLNNSNLYLNTSNNTISVGPINFNEYAQIFIGGYLLLIDSNIINDGEISVGGAIIISGSSTITGTGIII